MFIGLFSTGWCWFVFYRTVLVCSVHIVGYCLVLYMSVSIGLFCTDQFYWFVLCRSVLIRESRCFSIHHYSLISTFIFNPHHCTCLLFPCVSVTQLRPVLVRANQGLHETGKMTVELGDYITVIDGVYVSGHILCLPACVCGRSVAWWGLVTMVARCLCSIVECVGEVCAAPQRCSRWHAL